MVFDSHAPDVLCTVHLYIYVLYTGILQNLCQPYEQVGAMRLNYRTYAVGVWTINTTT